MLQEKPSQHKPFQEGGFEEKKATKPQGDALLTGLGLIPIISFVSHLLPQRFRIILFGRTVYHAVPSKGIELEPARKESLIRLQETQNHVISAIYRISITGFAVFFVIMLSLGLFLSVDPTSPLWLSSLILGVDGLLLVGLVRTFKEYKNYETHYQEVSKRLQELFRQKGLRQAGQEKEHRLISALKPQEHTGWDAKSCTKCQRSIELSSQTCPHCGEEQAPLLPN